MNFFENQDKARQNTQRLLGLFALSILMIILAIYITLLFLPYMLTSVDMSSFIWWNPTLFLSVSLVVIGIISLAIWSKNHSLREGGSVIAKYLGGTLITTETASEQEQQLLNIVEEMAIASGIPVPKVYLLYNEPNLNAFTAGFTFNDAVIGVTRGSIENFNRDELQAIIAHEFSHIINGDMRLNLQLVGLFHGILFIFILGRVTLDLYNLGMHNNDNKFSPWDGFISIFKIIGFYLFGLIFIIIGGIGLIFGRLIKAAISRQREFLADASAVQLTRNPDGLSEALQKIQQMDSRLLTSKAEVVSHMFFSDAVGTYFWENWFATHPPIPIRIHRISGIKVKNNPAYYRNFLQSNHSLVMGFAGSNYQTKKPDKITNRIAKVTPKHLDFTQQLLAELPESLKLGIRETQTAQEILFALALENKNSQIQEKQITWLRQVQPEEVINSSIKFNQEISQLDSNTYLPLLDLTIPALHQLSPKECQRVCKSIQGLIAAKGQISVRDFVLRLILWHRLQPILEPNYNISIKFNSIK